MIISLSSSRTWYYLSIFVDVCSYSYIYGDIYWYLLILVDGCDFCLVLPIGIDDTQLVMFLVWTMWDCLPFFRIHYKSNGNNENHCCWWGVYFFIFTLFPCIFSAAFVLFDFAVKVTEIIKSIPPDKRPIKWTTVCETAHMYIYIYIYMYIHILMYLFYM